MTPDKDEEERDDDDLDDEEGNHMAASSNLRHRDAGFNFSGGIDMLFIKKNISEFDMAWPCYFFRKCESTVLYGRERQ